MRKFLFISIVIMIIGFIGCETTPTEIESPTDFEILQVINGVDLKFSWTASTTTNIDGYRIYWNSGTKAGDSLLWEGTGTSVTLTNPPVGKFYVTAYKGNNESDPSDIIDTRPVSGVSPEIWYRADPDPAHPSGFYWDNDGLAFSTPLSDTIQRKLIDFYFDSDTTFTSPHSLQNANLTKKTKFKYTTALFDQIQEAPSDMGTYYATLLPMELNDVYFVYIESESTYALIKITQLTKTNTVSAKFSYKFQKIKNYRKFK